MAKAQVNENTDEKDGFVDELKPGTKLMHGQYTIESFLNAGGFGITYLARDSLDRKVVIKECFPGAFCRRSRYVVQARSRAHQNELKSIVRLFVQEARSLSKLSHPNIVGVHQVFEDNDTAYMALDFVEGRDLLDTIEDPNHGLTPSQIRSILKEVLGAVGFIHDQGILHRDISPDNILINKELRPVLIDFGAAREEATKQSRVLSALRVVKDGYSPQEFYIAGSDQSPSSDLYALAASFHHLIAKDVPPNSQARLAAIASGDADPYVPLKGRFAEYDEAFLGALDKALAVLPKDRLQSAKEWLDAMDGVQGNVTPLKVAASNKAPTPAANVAAPKKSNVPILLGSAAAVALIVGIGVVTMTGGADAPVTAPAVATSQAPAETAPVEETAAPTVAETAPQDAAPAPGTPTRFSFQPEAPAVVETPAPVASEAPAPVIVEEPVETATAPVVVEGPVIVDEPTETASAPTVVEGPVVVDTPTPEVRPEARPEIVALETVPEPVPLPDPVITPRPDASEPAAGATFPDQTANRPSADTETAALNLPATPENVEEIGTGPTVEITAVTPGNELVDDSLVSAWSVQLPFTPAGAQSNIVAEVGPISPVWVQPGLVITGINGTPISAISEIPDVLRAQTDESTLSPTIAVTFGTLDPASGQSADQQWVLPVVQEVSLRNGASFQTVYSGGNWKTTVTDLADGQEGGLEVGDVITSYITTSESLNERDSLLNIVAREIENGTEQLMFAVQRDGSLWVASLALNETVE